MPDPDSFVPVTVLKRDSFSETVFGHAEGDENRKLVLRRLDTLSQPGRSIGRVLAGREARALGAVSHIAGTPSLVSFDDRGLLRLWLEGTPLHLARPSDPAFYKDALRLVREIHRHGVTHNDLAKPQNWLMTPDGRAAVIDFQISTMSSRRGRLFKLRAYEDLRHMLKQKRRYAPEFLTPTERRIVDRRSLPSRVWRNTAKPTYNFVTRRLMHWSDGEGAGKRLSEDAPEIRALLMAEPGVDAVEIFTYPRAGGGQGLYGFVETQLDVPTLRRLVPEKQLELLQTSRALPRTEGGTVRQDLLSLVAGNRIDELEQIASANPPETGDLEDLVANRLNLTDRV